MYNKIKINDFVKLNNPLVIDVREPYEFNQGSIPNAINIPVDILLNNYNQYLNKNNTYYLYCETSVRSGKVCEYLSNLGYNVYFIEGGYNNWLSNNHRNYY